MSALAHALFGTSSPRSIMFEVVAFLIAGGCVGVVVGQAYHFVTGYGGAYQPTAISDGSGRALRVVIRLIALGTIIYVVMSVTGRHL